MALNGAVYNVTQYMDFHPGGWDELIKGAGRDATDMFNEIHKWVNYQGMMEACLVGKLVDGPSEEVMPPPPKISGPALLPPPPGAETETREAERSPTNRLLTRITSLCSGGFCAGKILLSVFSVVLSFEEHFDFKLNIISCSAASYQGQTCLAHHGLLPDRDQDDRQYLYQEVKFRY